MAGLSNAQRDAIMSALSATRMSRFLTAAGNDRDRALELYRWNAQVSSAFFVPMHICEVVLRNAIVGAIQEIYGPNWFDAGTAFERSLPNPRAGYSPRQDLTISRRGQASAGKVIPELKFMFWISMVTARHDTRLWCRIWRSISHDFCPPQMRPTASACCTRGWKRYVSCETESRTMNLSSIAELWTIFESS